MEEAVRKLLDLASKGIAESRDDRRALEQLKVRLLGRKGELAALFKNLGKVSEADRPLVGKILNDAKVSLEKMLAEALEESREQSIRRRKRFDVTVPGRMPLRGRLHPITQTALEISRIFN